MISTVNVLFIVYFIFSKYGTLSLTKVIIHNLIKLTTVFSVGMLLKIFVCTGHPLCKDHRKIFRSENQEYLPC